jgi:hypothetical protein
MGPDGLRCLLGFHCPYTLINQVSTFYFYLKIKLIFLCLKIYDINNKMILTETIVFISSYFHPIFEHTRFLNQSHEYILFSLHEVRFSNIVTVY